MSCLTSSVLHIFKTSVVGTLIVAGAVQALAQSDKNASDAPAGGSVADVGNSVYSVTVLHNLYRYEPTQVVVATGILVKKPNVLITTRIMDGNGRDVFEDYRRTVEVLGDRVKGYMASVCESEPDPTKLEKARKELEERFKGDDKEKNAELNKFKDDRDRIAKAFDTSSNEEKAKREKEKEKEAKARKEDEDRKVSELRSKDVTAHIAWNEQCSTFIVKKIDKDRNLVILEASDPLHGSVPQFNVGHPAVGSSVSAYGFPVSTWDMQTRRATSKDVERSRLVPAVLTNTVVKVATDKNRPLDEGQIIMHQVPIRNGTYGGPLVNSCGEIVGMNLAPQRVEQVLTKQGTATETGKNQGKIDLKTISIAPQEIYEAIGAREVKTFAELNNISLNVIDKLCDPVKPATIDLRQIRQNPWLIGLGALTLLLAATALVFSLRRPQSATVLTGGSLSQREGEGTLFEPGYRGSLPPGGATEYDQFSMPAGHIETLPTVPPPGSAAVAHAAPAGEATASIRVRLVPVAGGAGIDIDSRKVAAGGAIVGRDHQNDVVCDNSTVSKQHARLTLMPSGKLQVDDLGSANGTWRGRQRIQHEAFSSGDTVRFGAVEYRVEITGGGGSAAGETVFMTPSRSWVLSGFDENGTTIHWKLQPEVDTNGRQKETSWSVGRSSERVTFALGDKSVSSEHAKIRFTPQRGLEICDLSSSNGTKVDGRVVKDSFVVIDDAQVVEFGARKLTLSKAYA